MDARTVYEVIGYVASALIAVSQMMTSILKLRIINLVGSACFTVYGLLIGAYPIAIVNGLIVVINLYHLYEAYSAKEYFNVVAVRPDSAYLIYFLKFYESEIKKYFPGFTFAPSGGQVTLFVLRDMIPAGLLIAAPMPEDALMIKLDFVIPGYRDFKIGKFVFSDKIEEFRKRGIRKICSEPGTKKHQQYLRSMGFVPERQGDESGLYVLTLA